MGLRLESKESREAARVWSSYCTELREGHGHRVIVPWLLRFTKTLVYCLTEVYSREVAWEPGTAVHTSDLSSPSIYVYDTQSHVSYDPRMTDQASSVIDSDLDNDNIPPKMGFNWTYRQVHSDSSASSQCSLTVGLWDLTASIMVPDSHY